MNQTTLRRLARRAGRLRWRRVAAVLASLPLALLPLACGPQAYDDPLRPYLPRSAHQAYAHSLVQTRLAQSALGRDWIEEGEGAVLAPRPVGLPWKTTAALSAAEPRAIGLSFAVVSGNRLSVRVRLSADPPLDLFVDLFESDAGRLVPVQSAPPRIRFIDGFAELRLERSVLEDSDFVLRLQPELLRGAELEIEIESSPLLAFPVSGLGKGAIQSGFGAERDGGRRAHRGVDIFAPRGTEAVAAVDAWVARVDTTPRGGNVVWLQPLFGNMRLYYAHLDTHTVEEGEFVLAGDVVGTVGNTGNAITTPPHLHFGVYLRRRGFRGGAQDPFEFL